MDMGTGAILFVAAATWAPVSASHSPVSSHLSNSVYLGIYGFIKFLVESTISYQEHVS